jgi:hypothetical protein
MKKYLLHRLHYFDHAGNPQKMAEEKEKAIILLKNFWQRTAELSNQPGLTPATGNMFFTLTGFMDIASKRDALLMAGIPEPIQYMLFFLAFAISFIGGFTTPILRIKEWIIVTGFALMATVIIYISIDLGRPLRGLIKPDLGQDRLIELLKLY